MPRSNAASLDRDVPRRRLPGAIAIGLIVLAAVYLASRIVVNGVAQAHFADSDLPGAYAVNRRDGMVAGYLAWALQRAGPHRAAGLLAGEALRQTPLSEAAASVLAAQSAAADPAAAVKLLHFAEAMNWRDPVTQRWAAQVAIGLANYPVAARHLDAAARAGGVTPDIRALIDRMIADPRSRGAIVGRFTLLPPWRAAYLRNSAEPLGDLDARVTAVAALLDQPAAELDREKASLVMLAAVTNGPLPARAVWRRLYRPTTSGMVEDPTFKRVQMDPAVAIPFAWTADVVAGASITAEANGLHVTSDGSAVGSLVHQAIALPPGVHSVVTRASFGVPAAARAFRWNISCFDGRNATLLPTRAAPERQATQMTVDIPRDDTCPMQILALAAQPADVTGPADAWYSMVEVR